VGPPDVPPIGERIRAHRVLRGQSVRGLARDIGVSASLISQIETDKSQPSVSTLYAITTALGIAIEDLFTPVERPVPDQVDGSPAPTSAPPDARTAAAHTSGYATSANALVPDRGTRVGPVVHPDDRETLTLDSGVTWELLGQVPGTHVDFLRVTYEPGGSSSSSGLLMRHGGTEYGFLVSGELVLTLGFDEHPLGPGDAICFESTTPHGYRNDGDTPAIGIWFVLEGTG
jgi:transcriptional regulator with XRE-family HTH domain/quercetin dioxygenase-like cupin family protein